MKIINVILALSCFLLSSCSPFLSAINVTPSSKIGAIEFSNEQAKQNYEFYYSDTLNNKYLRGLRESYGIDSLTTNLSGEMDKIKAVLNWSSNQWEHNGSNSPSKPDALTILKEAKEGKQFRCVEYGVIAAASLNSLSIPARVLALKTKDVAKVKFGAGHVAAETYSQDFSKWIFIDPQFDIMPTLNGIPLNAVEFQKALISEKQNIELVNLKGKVEQKRSEFYLNWIGKYLYFFDVGFDQRIDYKKETKKIDGKTRLMLVAVGAENPTIFQRKYNIDKCIYTNSLNDFYKKPRD